MAMECRCYRGGDGRTRLKVLRCEKQDYIDLAVCIACFAVILASRLVFPNFWIDMFSFRHGYRRDFRLAGLLGWRL